MSDKEWLADYWAYPDEQQAALLYYISQLDVEDLVQTVFDRFKNTGLYLSTQEVKRLHGHLKGSTFPEAERLKRRKRVKRRDAVVCYLIAEFLGIYALINQKAESVFSLIAKQKYNAVSGDGSGVGAINILDFPMASGKLLRYELLAHARFRAGQIADYYTMQVNYGVKPNSKDSSVLYVIKSEMNSLLRATKKGYMGLYDELMTNIVGYTTLQSFIDKGVKRVEFVAVMDARTTNRCAQLNGTRWNVDQLKLGFNVPPITIESVPHPCRSGLRIIKMK